jgi:hypothetical protein
MKKDKSKKKTHKKENKGWSCSKCDRSFAPHINECAYCNEYCFSPLPTFIPATIPNVGPTYPFTPWVEPFWPIIQPWEKTIYVGDIPPFGTTTGTTDKIPNAISTTGYKYPGTQTTISTSGSIDGCIPIEQCISRNEDPYTVVKG